MNINEIKDLMAQFDRSSLREFSYKNHTDELSFSKNEQAPLAVVEQKDPVQTGQATVSEALPVTSPPVEVVEESQASVEGDLVESPLVGVAYLSPAPDKEAFVSVGDTVKKGQTLLIVEAMKIMNEIPAPKDGVVTEILVANEEVVEFGKGLVRIK
ncbi:acetyl-CoA carboxylase biotin carboxyl carrier protein [Streptococcus sp. NLN76]|uniref:acetyl-CoA carboxylase biotin carboxyl carrier protein n=1 Tax=Streptococcus sp. NLN76 TaxID=2822800 RepID=UPI0018AA7A3B|nr:acetyl-CoA carboxylase biotin carboxyl carrier protein [Streptococcus sp. NLN76]MBF8970852.1 acetyl-CoA carboxylase biotin carboxyl carrier protein [Streptococcus sp. NLN76]